MKSLEFAETTPPSPRNLEDIAWLHAMHEDQLLEQLAGQVALDIGAGHSTLERDVMHNGVATKVISLDIPQVLCDPKAQLPYDTKVGADACELPFRDERFDIVIGTYSLPYWAVDSYHAIKCIHEALRVLRPGGSLHLSPFYIVSPHDEDVTEANSKLLGFAQHSHSLRDHQVTLTDDFPEDRSMPALKIVKP